LPNQQKFYRLLRHNSKGFSLIEVLIALALLGIIAVAFLGGIATASKAMFIADKRTTAESLARSEMEYVKNLPYEDGATEYDIDPSLSPDGYTISVDVDPLHDGIQEITVTVSHGGEAVIELEDYKVDR
jgi:prepilin-type N-terminal cleavage/methylation domain-containing protein